MLRMTRLDPDAEELKDTIARVARLVLEREREAGVAKQVRPDLPCRTLPCRMCHALVRARDCGGRMGFNKICLKVAHLLLSIACM